MKTNKMEFVRKLKSYFKKRYNCSLPQRDDLKMGLFDDGLTKVQEIWNRVLSISILKKQSTNNYRLTSL